ncbi:MAG: hypothetical protein B7733_03680 [Myxococcales bacterium FL481]|nr:MAG: hypothetical protein B7733_03680 [Myxococcales bacterium FL481]
MDVVSGKMTPLRPDGRPTVRDRWIATVLAHHRLVLWLAAVVTVAAALVASRLQIDSDLRRLLPGSHPVLTNLEAIERDFGAIGSVNLVVANGDQHARQAFAEAVADALADHPLLSSVDYRLHGDFFLERALYYLDDEEMEQLEERVAAWQNFELCSSAPDVCITKPDPQSRDKLRAFVDAKRSAARERVGFEAYYERDGIDALVVLLLPTRPSSDLAFAQQVTDRIRAEVEAQFERSDRPWSGTDMRINLVGPYVSKATEREVVNRDMVRSGLLGVSGVMLVLFLMFRSVRAVITLLVPLLCAVTWSLAATQLLFGHLNTMTSLISSVVMGMGIDAGIHLLSRARRERETCDTNEAVRRAFGGLIVPLLVASSTTLGAFLVMATSKFPAFQEFGAIAAIGVGLSLFSMLTVFPALACRVGIKRMRRGEQAEFEPARVVRLLLARPGALFAVLVGMTVLSAPTVMRMRIDGFENNGRALQSDRAREATESDVFLISDIFGKDIHAGILLLPSYDEAVRVFREAAARHAQREAAGTTVVAELFGLPALMPSAEIDVKDREERIALLTEDFSPGMWRKLGVEVEDEDDWDEDLDDESDSESETGSAPPAGHADGAPVTGQVQGEEPEEPRPPAPVPEASPRGDERGLSPADAALLRKMLEAKPFGVEDLPSNVLDKLRTADGRYVLLAYPNFDASDIVQGIAFMDETAAYRGDDSTRMYVGETSVYAAMYQMIERESPVILAMAVLLVMALVFWQVRSVSQTMLTLLPLLVGLWWTVAAMGVLGVKFTLFNVPILPAILGIGVDNGVFLTAGIRGGRGRDDGLALAVDETGRAILAATATTAIGFATFLVADSGGLRGIGALAVLGIVLTASAAVLVLPTLSALGQRRRANRSARSSSESSSDA